MVVPHCERLEVLILSLEQLNGLAFVQIPGHIELTDVAEDAQCLAVMRQLHQQWRCKRVALPRKTRDSVGIQRRWSLLTELPGSSANSSTDSVVEYTTKAQSVFHRPADECGGGSAWAAGLIHALHIAPASTASQALRRADLLSALCQETQGDFSRVTAKELQTAEQHFAGCEARLPGTGLSPGAKLFATALPSPADAKLQIESTLKLLKGSKVLAILRAKGSPEVAVERGLELASMGCCAMEVTLDSTDWQQVLSSLRQKLPQHVALGIGTVMDDTVGQLGLARSLGATFALSPIEPVGFIDECHRLGMLAIPAAFTSNELWDQHRRGARLIKLFHAGLASPAILKSMLDVTPLGKNLNILPSGGVSPGNAAEWLDAGASVVGMGSNLVGKDTTTTPGSEAHAAAVHEWHSKGRSAAEKVFRDIVAKTVVSIPSLQLQSGASVQQLAVGLYNVPREEVKRVIHASLDAGCRNFDFASFYNNELECGQALKEWLAKGHHRSELYITTKVWTTDMQDAKSAKRSALISIDELDLGPVDCLMVHWPTPGKHVAAYKALEEVVDAGKAKSLGISNYSPADYAELMKSARMAPVMNSFETNPMVYRKEWVDFFQEHGVVVSAYKPLQRSGPVLTNEIVVAIASRLRKSSAQVCLRWNVQKGNLVVFKSLSTARILENVNIFDFELSPADMAAMDTLTTAAAAKEAQEHWEKRRQGTPGPWGDSPRPLSRNAAPQSRM